eukprot:TRINITY_DN49977_c0_g1_i1.p1 TRINITY_DN49977_c0_g1~~TRINITY_DN49977_c0_g1_i1.p1  ORF type:complete len:395 (-),score=93.11 TRINITY_DN49977_c0_g1_i1:69-1142(-)
MEDGDIHEDDTAHKSHTVKQTADKADDGTPWAEETRGGGDPSRRIVGWRAGQSMTVGDVREIVRTDREARKEYRAIKRAAAKKPHAPPVDPLSGMPAQWQAFWQAVPHLDPRSAVKQHWREKEKAAKAEKREKRKLQGLQDGGRRAKHAKEDALGVSSGFAASSAPSSAPPSDMPGGHAQGDGERSSMDGGEAVTEVDIDEEITKLDAEVRKKREQLLQRQAESREWERKLVRARTLDRDEETRSKKLAKRVSYASYARGQAQGKLRSSDHYFEFLVQDADNMHKPTKANMKRSCALLHTSMVEIKEEIRALMHEIKAAASSDGDPEAPSTPRSSKALSLSGRSEDPSSRQRDDIAP